MWLLWAATFAKYALWLPLTSHGIDYIKHRRAAVAILEGRSPYDGDNYLRFNYPEFAAWVFVYLAWVPEDTGEADQDPGEIVWDLGNALFLAAALVIVIFGCRPRGPLETRAGPARVWVRAHWPAVAALLMGLFAPAFVGNHYANIEPFNLFLMALLLAALLRRRDTSAGILLAALALVKILPVLLLAPLWIARRRRAVWVTVALLAAYGLLLLATGWWRREWFLATQVLPNIGFHYRGISNAPASIITEYWMPSVWASKATYDTATRIGSAVAFVAFAAVLTLGWRGVAASWRRGLAFSSLSLVLIPPLFEYIHLIWALPAYVLLAVDWAEGRASHRMAALGGGFWLIVFACRYAQEVTNITEPMLPRHASTLFVIALWALAAWRLMSHKSETGEEGT